MGIISSLFESRATKQSLGHPRDPALVALFGGNESIAGVSVTQESALSVGAFYAAVSLIAETVGSLPAIVYQRQANGGKDRATDHANYRLLHDAPNPFMTSMEFFETQQWHLLGWGNSFAEIERNNSGRVVSLWPLLPNRMKIQVTADRLWYWYTNPDGREQQLRQDQVLHVRGMGSNGIIGYSPVDLHRETLGLASAEQEYRSRFFKNDARPGSVLEHPGRLGPEAHENLKKDLEEKYSGLSNKHRSMILEEGMKLHEIGVSPEQSQFIEGRKFSVEEIARIFRVPLVLLQSTEKATSWGTGIEQFMLSYLIFTLRPWLTRWEKRLTQSLFTGTERSNYFVQFLFEELLRADVKTRNDAYKVAIEGGWMTRNEARIHDNMNPRPGLDRFLVQQNLAQIDEQGNIIPINQPTDPTAPATDVPAQTA